MILTNAILSEKLGIPLYRFRRWTKELLPPDPVATRRGGVARQLTLNEGFRVYLGGLMVGSDPSFTFRIIRLLMNPIWAVLELHNVLPEISKNAVRAGIDLSVQWWERIEIAILPNSGRDSYYTNLRLVGSIDNISETLEDALGRRYLKTKLTHAEIPTETLKVSDTGFAITDEGPDLSSSDETTFVSLEVGHYLQTYLNRTGSAKDYRIKLSAIPDQEDTKKLAEYKRAISKIYKP